MADRAECPKEQVLRDFAAGYLEGTSAHDVQSHLDRCENCSKALSWMRSHLLREVESNSSAESDKTPRFAPTPSELTLTKAAEEWEQSAFDLHLLSPSGNETALGRLGKYDILSVQGHGGMGVVFKAYDEQLRRQAAIKVLNRSLTSSATARRRFIREARAAAAVNHPNVVTIYAVEEHQGIPFLVMEYIDGRSLRDRLHTENRLDPLEAVRLSAQIAAGLAAAHAQGVIHRDIKPGNIMLEGGRDRVKIADFGLARAAIDNVELTSRELAVGTPSYMAPEQVNELHTDARSDLFSLGCVIYAMIEGHSPFHGRHALEMARKVSDFQPPCLRELNPRVPQFLSDLVERLLEKEPDKRIQSAMEVADMLNRHLAAINQANSDQISVLLNRPLDQRRSSRNVRRAVLLGTAVLGALAIAAAFLTAHWQSNRAANDSGNSRPGSTANQGSPAALQGVITVSRSGPAQFQTLDEALRRAGPGTEIRILDDGEYRGPIVIDNPSQWEGLKIVGAGETVLTAPPPHTVLHIAGTSSVEVRGVRMKAHKSQHGIEITGPCPGVVIEHVRAERTDESLRKGAPAANLGFAYIHDGARGDESAPIVLRDVAVQGGAVGIVIGEQAESSPNDATPVKWVQLEDCRLLGSKDGGGYLIIFLNSIENILIARNTLANADAGISLATPYAMQVRNLSITHNTFYNLNQLMVFGTSSVEQDDVRIHDNLILKTKSIAVGESELNAISARWFSRNWWEATPDVDVTLAGKIAELVGSVPVMTTEPDSSEFLRPLVDQLRPHMKPGEDVPGKFGGEPHENSKPK